ncbi:MAG: hypothetical protein FWF15_05575 [Oscillospiraceae bacterium]|nr:hypothetical protein [Oscillospiraceae bacterium]
MNLNALHAFEFNGTRSDQCGIVIKDKNAFNVPARDVTKQSIPGRNGDLIIDNGRYFNIDVVYKCTIVNFEGNINNIKNWLPAYRGKYLILTDTYNPDVFRYASFSNAFNFANIKFGTGEGDIVFNCKPFQYLLTGNQPVTLTSSGNISNPTKYDALPRIKVVGSGNYH